MKPTIIESQGFHNSNPKTNDRLIKGKAFEDLSTICIVPTRGVIPARVVESWMSLMTPMNQKFYRIFMAGMEVGEAYNAAIENILAHPELSKWKYILTMEEDNIPPPDGLLRLYEGMKDYDVVGGLYWTKGPEGMPMQYGDPKVFPRNFVPQLPLPDQLNHCNGLGMGFNLYKMEIFKNKKLKKPWFKSQQEFIPQVGVKAFSQDLYFYHNIAELGYRCACDSRIRVGHYDFEGKFGPEDFCW